MHLCGTARRDDFNVFLNFACGSIYQYRLTARIGAKFGSPHL
jgi:hypothetical protein